MNLIPKTISYIASEGNVIENYLPPALKRNKVYRVSKIKKNGWGTLVKTDRLPYWINMDWFREV